MEQRLNLIESISVKSTSDVGSKWSWNVGIKLIQISALTFEIPKSSLFSWFKGGLDYRSRILIFTIKIIWICVEIPSFQIRSRFNPIRPVLSDHFWNTGPLPRLHLFVPGKPSHGPTAHCRGRCGMSFTNYLSWPAGTAIAKSKQRLHSQVATLVCFGTAMVERAPCRQDCRVPHQLLQETQDPLDQSSHGLCLASFLPSPSPFHSIPLYVCMYWHLN